MTKLSTQQDDEFISDSLLFSPAASCFGVDEDLQGIETTANALEKMF